MQMQRISIWGGIRMSQIIVELREYPLEEKISIEELTPEGARMLINDCERLLSDLKDVED